MANRAPIANAGPDQLTQSLTAITLSGASSSDPDGSIASCAWSFGDGTSGAGMTVTKAYQRPGTFIATLTVMDDKGATATDTAMVQVANRPPVANAGPDQTVVTGSPATLSGAASSDADGTIVAYAWSFGDGTTASGPTATKTWSAPGTYVVTLTVTDDMGATGTDTATVTVTAATISGVRTQWAVRAGGVGYDEAKGVAVDGFGNVLLTGEVAGPADFGGLVCANSIFVAKYTPAGVPLWVQCLGGASGGGSGRALAVDPANGDVVVTGYFRGVVDFGNGPLASTDGFDGFLARYTANGVPLWSRQFGAPVVSAIVTQAGTSVAIDHHGNIVLTGMFESTADFGTGPLTSAGQGDIFLAKYTGAGTTLWARRFGGLYADVGYGVAVDAADNIVVTGTYYGPTDFGGGALPSASFDAFLAKFAPTGAHVWSKHFGGTLGDEGHGVAVDAAGNVFVTGIFQNTADFGGGPFTSLGGNDIFLAKYGPAGDHVWSKAFGSTSSFDAGNAVAVDSPGNVVLAGFFSRTVDFGTGALTSLGTKEAFVARWTGAGVPQWSARYGSTSIDAADAVTVDASGAAIACGTFNGTVDFGAGSLTSVGDFEAFVLKLGN